MEKDLPIIGSTEYVEIAGIKNIPAKIDTGADSSSIWVSHIRVTQDGMLHFCLFDEDCPLYTGEEIETSDFRPVIVRSASGHEQIRYRTKMQMILGGRRIGTSFNLSDRSNNNFPVLIGRRTISGKFLVDVSKNSPQKKPITSRMQVLREHLAADPYDFHEKYMKDYPGSVDDSELKEYLGDDVEELEDDSDILNIKKGA